MTSSVIGRRSSKGESGNYIIEPHPDTHSSAKAVKGFMGWSHAGTWPYRK